MELLELDDDVLVGSMLGTERPWTIASRLRNKRGGNERCDRKGMVLSSCGSEHFPDQVEKKGYRVRVRTAP